MPRGFLDRHLHRRHHHHHHHDSTSSTTSGTTTSTTASTSTNTTTTTSLTSTAASGGSKKGSRLWPEECCGNESDQLPEDHHNAAASTTSSSSIAAAAAAAAATLHSPQQHHHLQDGPHALYRGLPKALQGEPRPSQLLEDDLKEVIARGSKTGSGVLLPLVCVVVGAWLLGAWGASWAWLVICVAFTWALVTGALQRAAQDAARHESLRLSRRRALQADESCEWLNLLVNRWWVFSSASIFARVKAALDPRLAEAKPAFLETISLKQLSLGDRTPVLRSVRAWDVTATTDPSCPRRPHCPTRPPPGLAHAPTHTLALVCDLALDSDSFSAVLAARIGGKGRMGVELDVGVEKLAVLGRVVVTATLDMEAPFPHVARLSLSFTEKPQVWFSVRVLKAVQMMELPVLKTWLHSLVMDALSTAWVDPGQLEINIHTSEIIVPETRAGDTLAQGVLTVILWTLKGTSGLDEDKWVVVHVDGQQHVTPTIASQRWQEACSFLVSSAPGNHNLVLKVKTKRLITTTLTQFDLPLSQYGLENCKVAETVLQKKGGKVIGASIPPIHLRLQYTPLTPITLEAPLPCPLTENQEGAGVLYIMVHGADNITTTSEQSPSPYCLIFNNRKKVKTTHYVSECGSPRWECGVEVLVREVCAVTLAVAVLSLPRTAPLQDTELLGLATLSLTTVKLPMVRRPLPLTRSLPTPGTAPTTSTPTGTVTVTVIFRSVPSVAGCNISSGPDSTLERTSQAVFGTAASGQPPPTLGTPSGSLRRSSLTGLGDEEDMMGKKRPNAPWYSQASRRWGTQAGTQDIGDILASGLGLMELTIIRARDLVAKDLNGYSDPYCVVKVNGEVKYRTRVKKKTLNPEWEETLMTHLPKHPDHLSITLWDHDAFGRDFLGSVSLGEEEVRGMSVSDAPVWCLLEGTKSGYLEVRIKVISDDYEHQIKAVDESSTTATASTEGRLAMEGAEEDIENSSVVFQDSLEEPDSPAPSSAVSENKSVEPPALPNGRRASESAILDSPREETVNHSSHSGTMSASATPASSSPIHHPGRTRRTGTGAKIIASALSMARARSHEASPAHSPKKPNPIPKISLTEHHSEDDYGGGSSSSPEHHHQQHQQHSHSQPHHKSKKSSDGGLRAMREKVRRGLAHPLRRFRSEANVREEQQRQQEEEEEEEELEGSGHDLRGSMHHSSHHSRLQLSLSVGVPVRVGVGGGESDASELLGGDAPLSHAKSQPNLLLEAARLSSSTKALSSSNNMNNNNNNNNSSGSSIPQRAEVFVNVHGVARRVQGLHIPRSGLQLFLRVRISDEKGGGSLSSSSSSSSGNRSTKTVGRSRLVPACPSPSFDCDWQVENEVSRRATLVLEVRSGSRQLLNSANVALGDLFTEPGTEGSVERWINLQGGATLLLRACHGGDAPPTSRRRSLFRSWSLHRLGKI
ncbi:uncharacterized protein LOC126999964 isoform X5 [Eriocheir sinensis]|uniref:uncharacterized protein LOC126999964 isoform X5 n=1 Tax=Eriocheir sinensis TaxID=95602 RepID=UPI0021CA1AFD|nr:uncharacterized protein LOC126999964 isoform X5 [Eriocheir sinensis]